MMCLYIKKVDKMKKQKKNLIQPIRQPLISLSQPVFFNSTSSISDNSSGSTIFAFHQRRKSMIGVFLDWERVEVDLFQGFDLAVSDQSAKLGAMYPLLLISLAATRVSTTSTDTPVPPWLPNPCPEPPLSLPISAVVFFYFG